MRFAETPIPGAFVIELEPREDERGAFVRTFDADQFRAHGLDPAVAQGSVSVNLKAGTLRGVHYQAAPFGEGKLVRCARGAVYDVIVDLREDQTTYRSWHAVELGPHTGTMLYVPPGVAHGFQTLEDDTEVAYQMSVGHAPGHARGVRFDDPALGIVWPDAERTVSERDRTWPLLEPGSVGETDAREEPRGP